MQTGIMETITHIVETANQFLWGLPMILLLAGTHLFLTWKTGFIQRKLPLAIRLSLSRGTASDGGISPFAALSAALASTLGTGNIIGVGTAIALGGPGAVFWCWLTGIFGMATSYAEALIAAKYRVRAADGSLQGGAMYALERRLHLKPLAVLFAVFGVLASFGIGCGVQANAISEAVAPVIARAAGRFAPLAGLLERFPRLPSLAVGLAAGLLTCAVIFGGTYSVSRVCEKLVPVMAGLYLLGCFSILWMNRALLGEAAILIVKSAFLETEALGGGLAGSGILLAARYGVSRGLFSNEAGMGSAPLIFSSAHSRNPVCQALAASTAAFWDTVVVCLITGLVLITSLLKADPAQLPPTSGGSLDGAELVSAAFSQLPHIGRPLLLFGILTFAYATILGWSCCGERCLFYLSGNRLLFPYRFLWILVIVFSPVLQLELVWGISDALNALMALPNILAVLLLSREIARDTRYYLKHLDEKA